MATRFVTVDRDTPMLLPPDLRDWVTAKDPARLIVALMEHTDLSSAAVNVKGTGSKQYPPSMMLALLLHSYVHGVFSSREIEGSTHTHIGVRYITANEHPDHDTICKFRRENRELIRESFKQCLQLASQVGILQLGTVAMDGTKIKGDIDSDKTLTIEQVDAKIETIEKEEKVLQIKIDALLEQAETTDRREAAEASPASGELKDSELLKERLKIAKLEIAKKERKRARLEAARAQFAERKQREADERSEMREKIREAGIGHLPDKREAELKPSDKVNTTDTDTTKMKGGRGGFVEGYNARGVVDCEGSGLLLAMRVSQESSDRQELMANLAELEANVGKGKVEATLGDKGYDNSYQINEIEREGGPTMLCLQQRTNEENKRARQGIEEKPKKTCRGRALRTWKQRQKLYQRLREPANRAKQKRRRETIEPSFGIIKEQMGFRKFHLRGEERVDTEWSLVGFAFNLRKLNRNVNWIEYLN